MGYIPFPLSALRCTESAPDMPAGKLLGNVHIFTDRPELRIEKLQIEGDPLEKMEVGLEKEVELKNEVKLETGVKLKSGSEEGLGDGGKAKVEKLEMAYDLMPQTGDRACHAPRWRTEPTCLRNLVDWCSSVLTRRR